MYVFVSYNPVAPLIELTDESVSAPHILRSSEPLRLKLIRARFPGSSDFAHRPVFDRIADFLVRLLSRTPRPYSAVAPLSSAERASIRALRAHVRTCTCTL